MSADEVARKKTAHAIVIGIEPDGDRKEPDGPDVGLVAAMKELSAALEKKDFDAAADAFASAHEICKGADYGPETEGEDGEG